MLSISQLTGVLTLSALDVTDPHNPAVLSTRATEISVSNTYSGIAPLGNGFFAVSVGPTGGRRDPIRGRLAWPATAGSMPTILAHLGLYSMGYVAKAQGLTAVGSTLYVSTGDGLTTFQLPDLSGL